ARQCLAHAAPKAPGCEAGPLVSAVQRPPDQKGPADAVAQAGMPESADQEHDHDVDGAAQRSGAAAAERDVEIVAKPMGERDVPAATPEFGRAARQIRPAEVLHE